MRLRGLIVLLACACVAAATAVAAAPTLAKKAPTATLLAQNAAFNAANWKALWSAYTPNYQSHCGPYSKFAQNLRAARARISGSLTTRVTGVQIKGSKAYLAYQLLARGTAVATVKASSPDVYVKTGGLWYDEYEPTHGC